MARTFRPSTNPTDRIELSYTGNLAQYTVSCWTWANSVDEIARRFYDRENGITQLFLQSTNSRVELQKQISSGAGRNVRWASGDVPLNQWFHWALTIDTTTTSTPFAHMYFNGVELSYKSGYENVAFDGTPKVITEPFIVGNRNNGGSYDRCWNGRHAHFAIWDSILTSTEINDLVSGQVVPGYVCWAEIDAATGAIEHGEGMDGADVFGTEASASEPPVTYSFYTPKPYAFINME